MKVTNEIEVYEVDGKDETPAVDRIKIHVESHWNMNDRVVLNMGDIKYTVMADDLEKAIRNATNHRRY